MTAPHALDLGDDDVLRAVLDLQHAAYAVEADLIGSDAIPALHETADDVRAAPERWIGTSDGQQLVGALAYLTTPDLLDISKLVVAPEAARQGHGERLVRWILDAVPRPLTIVSTGAANTPAVALYAKVGFVAVGDDEVVPGLTVRRFERRR